MYDLSYTAWTWLEKHNRFYTIAILLRPRLRSSFWKELLNTNPFWGILSRFQDFIV
jgi:hypothetical protein